MPGAACALSLPNTSRLTTTVLTANAADSPYAAAVCCSEPGHSFDSKDYDGRNNGEISQDVGRKPSRPQVNNF